MSTDPHQHGTDPRTYSKRPEEEDKPPIMDEEDNFKALQKEVKYLRNLCGQLQLQNKLLRLPPGQ